MAGEAPASTPVAAPEPVAGSPEYNAAMVARADGQQAPAPAATPHPGIPATQRPAWLPEKFASVEDMAKAYAELERKQSGTITAPPPAATPPATPAADTKSSLTIEQAQAATTAAGVDFNALSTEYTEKGSLSPETYANLAAKGFTKDVVDTFIAGQQSKAAEAAKAYDTAAFTQAGGEAKFQEMTTWAKTALSPAEKTAFNDAVSSGDVSKMQLAVANLRTRFEGSVGSAPNLLTGQTPASGVVGYESQEQMIADMSKPEYERDPAFQRKVMARVAVSAFMGSRTM